MLVLSIVSKIPISWGIDIVRWWRSVITTKFGQKWNSWLKAADELFWLRYASKTKGMFWVTPSHKIKWQERKPFSHLKCLKQNKTKTKGMLWVTPSHKIKWQERRPFSHLSAFKSVSQFSILCRSLARCFLAPFFVIILKEQMVKGSQ